jgi:hypothetical protein
MPRTPTELSPRGAILLGLLFTAGGVAPILGALEIIPYRLTKGTPVWVGIAAGVLFILFGASFINGYVFGGGKNFDAEAPPLVRAIQSVLGFAILAAFASIAGWIGFGPGEREFSSSVSLPFWSSEGRGNVSLGRAAFGLAAILCAAFAIAVAFAGFRKRK